jgi:hypothetical protein
MQQSSTAKVVQLPPRVDRGEELEYVAFIGGSYPPHPARRGDDLKSYIKRDSRCRIWHKGTRIIWELFADDIDEDRPLPEPLHRASYPDTIAVTWPRV